MKEREFPVLVEGAQMLEVLSVLGRGGAKTVLEVSTGGLRRAIAIPNQTDSVEVRNEKWRNVLSEPDAAAFLRENNLLVNPAYEVTSMLVDGENIQAISMIPFSELPFTVIDAKDGAATWQSGPLSHIAHYEDILGSVSGIGQDIDTLARLGICLRGDSISFAVMPEGDLRLFLFDLEGMKVDETVDARDAASAYAQLVVAKLDNVFDFEQGIRFSKQGYGLQERMELAHTLAHTHSTSGS